MRQFTRPALSVLAAASLVVTITIPAGAQSGSRSYPSSGSSRRASPPVSPSRGEQSRGSSSARSRSSRTKGNRGRASNATRPSSIAVRSKRSKTTTITSTTGANEWPCATRRFTVFRRSRTPGSLNSLSHAIRFPWKRRPGSIAAAPNTAIHGKQRGKNMMPRQNSRAFASMAAIAANDN